MSFLDLVQVAAEGLANNKLRALLTMLGVIIGVAAVIIMMAVSAGTEAAIAERITSLGANLIFVRPAFGIGGARGERAMARPSLTFDDAKAIAEQIARVKGVTVEQNTMQTVKYGANALTDIAVIGTTPDFPTVREVRVADGRFFNEQEVDRTAKVCVLGYSVAQELFGDADPIGEKVMVGNTKLTVIGVMAERGTVGNQDWDARIYTPITVVFQKFMPSQFARVMGDRVGMIYVQAESQEAIPTVITQITYLLAKRHGVTVDEPDFSVQTQQDIISAQQATTAAFRNLLAWVAGVSLLVGGIGIMNIMLVSVTERTREIGIRQSVGATEADMRWQFLAEALVLSLTGGAIGVLGGVGGAWVFARLSEMRTVVVPNSIALAFGSAAAVGIFFGFYPANKAARLDPIEALRHE